MEKKDLEEDITGDYVYPLSFIHWKTKKRIFRPGGGRFKIPIKKKTTQQ